MMAKQALYISDLLFINAEKTPDKEALIYENVHYSWADLATRVRQRMDALHAAGVKPGEVVGILLPNSPEFIITHCALLALRSISCPFDPTLKGLEVSALIEGMEVTTILTSSELIHSVRELSSSAAVYDVLTLSATTSSGEILAEPPELCPATMLFTSGTTGKPKATLYSHASHLWNVKTLASLWDWTSDDTVLLSLPLSHWHGLVIGLTGWLFTGCTLYLEAQFQAGRTLALLSSGVISLFMHVPPAYLKMIHAEPDVEFDLSSVRLCISGSSYLPPIVWEQFRSRFGQEILERYGSSEAGIITSNRLHERLAGNVGYPLPGVEVRLLENHELGVKSPGNFLRYYHNPTASKAKFTEDGFLKTGDLGEIGADGRVRLTGRMEERIKKFAYTINPRDIEWALAKNPQVIDVFVLGLQSQDVDDEIVTFLVAKPGTKEATLRDYAKENLPFYWRPDRYLFLDEIPKTRSGKPKLRQLREMAAPSIEGFQK